MFCMSRGKIAACFLFWHSVRYSIRHSVRYSIRHSVLHKNNGRFGVMVLAASDGRIKDMGFSHAHGLQLLNS
jgi:hypothetical protein